MAGVSIIPETFVNCLHFLSVPIKELRILLLPFDYSFIQIGQYYESAFALFFLSLGPIYCYNIRSGVPAFHLEIPLKNSK